MRSYTLIMHGKTTVGMIGKYSQICWTFIELVANICP